MRTFSVGRTPEEGHDVVEIRVVDLDGNVAASEESAISERSRGTTRTTHWTQGCIRSLYHSGNRVDLSTVAFIDMRRWKRPLQPFPSTSMTYLYCVEEKLVSSPCRSQGGSNAPGTTRRVPSSP